MLQGRAALPVLVVALGCSDSRSTGPAPIDATEGGGITGDATSASPDAESSSEGGVVDDSGDDGPHVKLDVGGGGGQDSGGGPTQVCDVGDASDDVAPCHQLAPPGSFEPDVQWSWSDEYGYTQIVVTPLVANLDDDNGDGVVDLCDTPEIVVLAYADLLGYGHIFVLSGDDGTVEAAFEHPLDPTVTPALADIDGDGDIEILAVDGKSLVDVVPGHLVAFDAQGNVEWISDDVATPSGIGAVAIADLEADGDVEILFANGVYDHQGALLWSRDESPSEAASLVTAADLDGDGDLEVVHGRAAYHHDGTVYYQTTIARGFPHVADFDDDGDPEILVTNGDGLALVDHTGDVLWSAARPTGDSASSDLVWLKPGSVHDFDGDGDVEFATGSANHYSVIDIASEGPTVVWSAAVEDLTGSSGGTAFDFDGNGRAEAMYADETRLFVFDDSGAPLFTATRDSVTGVEYPVVADVDADGSAEIVVVSNTQTRSGAPAVMVIRDVEDRWIPARKIWNQHTYHVSNVNEDGTVPTGEVPAWQQLNTFRTNSQVEGGAICRPEG
ncbi:MAG TPA: hypothetical protein VG755_35360 [Nannocystaceae bacterium]|nr:hypothetical protein [Nannocystaceae bacterium]